MGMTLLDAIPFLVEAGVLLDLFVAIFVMGIIIYQLNREFASLDKPTRGERSINSILFGA